MPTLAEMFALAGRHHQAGNLGEAEQLYRQVLAAAPDHPDTLHLLGVVAYQTGRYEQAASLIQQALAIRADIADYHSNLGITLQALGRLREAEMNLRQAVNLSGASADAQSNLGDVLRIAGKLDEAESHSRLAVQLQPGHATAHATLGNTLLAKKQWDVALVEYKESLRLRPNYAEVCSNMAFVLHVQGRLEEAVPHYHQALRLQPTLPAAWTNYMTCLNFDPRVSPETVFAEHRRWAERHNQVTPAPHANDRNAERILRVGYVSPDFRKHAVASYIEPVLANHDPAQVEVVCYAQVAVPDAVTMRIKNLVQEWRWTTGLSDAQLAEQIRDDRIDILVDLAGHTLNNRLAVFAMKPTPIQATWLGYMNTTGLTAVDYRLTDEVLDPPGRPVRDTEELYRLPGGFCCFAPPPDAPPLSPLPALERGYITFGSLNSLTKLNSGVFDLWSRVLKAVPKARLLMFRDALVGSARDNVIRQFQSRGIAGDRLDLRQGTGREGYLEIYNEIDVTLDAFPCTGGVTTCDSLWMGAPVLTLAGERPAGRNSAALLARVGLTDWTAATADQYVNLAVVAAGRLESLATLRAGLRERLAGTLCDSKRFTRELERAYRTMWRRWVQH